MVWESAHGRPWGTAAERVLVRAPHVVPLPSAASLELGAALGVPFLTAHRCLTLGESMPSRVAPGSFAGRTVLVQGGAGAVGNAAVQLATWAGARVVATVSGPEKAQLAAAAGAHDVVDYRREDVVTRVRDLAPGGVDVVVEVSGANAARDAQVLALHGAVALYAGVPGESVTGREATLPLTVFPLADAARAHAAVEGGAVGKVLVDVTA